MILRGRGRLAPGGDPISITEKHVELAKLARRLGGKGVTPEIIRDNLQAIKGQGGEEAMIEQLELMPGDEIEYEVNLKGRNPYHRSRKSRGEIVDINSQMIVLKGATGYRETISLSDLKTGTVRILQAFNGEGDIDMGKVNWADYDKQIEELLKKGVSSPVIRTELGLFHISTQALDYHIMRNIDLANARSEGRNQAKDPENGSKPATSGTQNGAEPGAAEPNNENVPPQPQSNDMSGEKNTPAAEHQGNSTVDPRSDLEAMFTDEIEALRRELAATDRLASSVATQLKEIMESFQGGENEEIRTRLSEVSTAISELAEKSQIQFRAAGELLASLDKSYHQQQHKIEQLQATVSALDGVSIEAFDHILSRINALEQRPAAGGGNEVQQIMDYTLALLGLPARMDNGKLEDLKVIKSA